MLADNLVDLSQQIQQQVQIQQVAQEPTRIEQPHYRAEQIAKQIPRP